jgi:multidrug efflux pump subunit AcrA (membrane-fusion protein)
MINRIKIIFGLLLIFGILVFGSLYFKSPYTINSKGILFPRKEWKLTKSSDGTINNKLTDNLTKSIPYFSSTEFGRGDHSKFKFAKDLKPGAKINRGDTIGRLFSHQEELKLLDLRQELTEQQGLRSISMTGEKPQRTRAALEALRMAEADLATEELSFRRSSQLHKMDVIADQEFEQMQNLYNQKKQQVLIARANYENLTAGSKKEEIQRIDAMIDVVRNQIKATRKRLDAFNITSPIKGHYVQRMQPKRVDEEVLAKVISCDQMALMIPVEISQMNFLSEGLKVILKNPLGGGKKEGAIVHINNSVEQLNGHQVVFVTCLVQNKNNELLPNLKVEAAIMGDPISILVHLKRFVTTIFTN